MNDLSALTHPTPQLRMRRDVFANGSAAYALKDLAHILEQCDRCGSRIPLGRIIFTGRQFLCPHCTQKSSG